MIELRPHQQKAVDEMHNGCILCGGVGSGKTITSLVYYWTKVCGGVVGDLGSLRTPTDLYVITTAKKRDSLDWEKECAQLGLSDERTSSIEALKITVDSWNNIDKYADVKNAFFVFDEQRLVGSGAWVKAFYDIAKNNKWVMLSATPGDTWIDYIPVFVANGFYRNRTEFKRIHVVYSTYTKFPKVDRYIGVNHLVKLRNKILVDMPYERHTVRHTVELEAEFDKELFDMVVKKRWHVYEERPIRDVAELFAVMRRVVNSDSSRLTHVRTLLREHKRLIVFYNFNYELEILRTLVPSDQIASPESIRDLKRKIDTTEVRVSSLSRKSSSPTKPSKTSTNGSMKNWEDECQTTSKSTEPPWEMCSPSCRGCKKYGSNGHTTAEATRITSDDMTRNVHIVEESEKQSTGSHSVSSSDSNSCDEKDPNGAALNSEKWSISSDTWTPETSFAVAEWNGHKHEKIPETDSWVYLVQYKAGSEGWNCIETNAICFYSLTYSYKDYEQSHGRIDRLNTPFVDLYYYVLKSKAMIDKAVWRSLSTKKSFNERKWASKMD